MNDLHTRFPDYSVFKFTQLNSTNQFLKQFAKSLANDITKPAVCIALQQLAGYGQRQSRWLSNQQSITFSILYKIKFPIHQLYGFSQSVALSIRNELSNLDPDHQFYVKWPNDIYLDGSKLAGILIESVRCDYDSCWLVIGVGVNFGDFRYSFKDYTARGLRVKQGRDFVLVKLIQTLDEFLNDFTDVYWQDHYSSWQMNDLVSLDQEIIMKASGRVTTGYYAGLDKSGSLLIKPSSNSVDCQTFPSGSISIRLTNE